MPRFGWSDEPDFLWSGFAEEDRAAYAVWSAMAGQDGDDPEEDDPPG